MDPGTTPAVDRRATPAPQRPAHRLAALTPSREIMLFRLKTWAAALSLALMAGGAPAALVLQANNVEVLDTDTTLLWLTSWRPSVEPLKTWAEGNA